jgi:hypothetical protein
MAGYGQLSWGTSRYGVGPSGPFTLTAAAALDTHRVRVTLSRAAQAVSAALPGDALNPATWTVTRSDTGAVLTLLAVEGGAGSVFALVTLDPLAGYNVSHTVAATTLKAANGDLISTPSSATFQGLAEAAVSQPAQGAPGSVDLRNLPVPDPVHFGGTLVMTPGGDYDVETGTALVKKLILRRLFSAPGDFFHLPDYGLGLRVKEPIAPGAMSRLKAEIERQVKLEPEVEQVRASLSLSTDGVLIVRVQARLTSGAPADLTTRVVAGVAF